MAFAEQLKDLMKKNGLKAVDLARATGLSEAAISDYLRGKKEPRGKQSISIAKALGVSLDTLWETDFGQSNRLLLSSSYTLANYEFLNNEFKNIVDSLVAQLLALQTQKEKQ